MCVKHHLTCEGCRWRSSDVPGPLQSTPLATFGRALVDQLLPPKRAVCYGEGVTRLTCRLARLIACVLAIPAWTWAARVHPHESTWLRPGACVLAVRLNRGHRHGRAAGRPRRPIAGVGDNFAVFRVN